VRDDEQRLLVSIREKLETLRELQRSADDVWSAEDLVYRFYHGSFKVYAIQTLTQRIVSELALLAPHLSFTSQFEEIFRNGTGRKFSESSNDHWSAEVRPLIEAYFHARYFLDMVVKYGETLQRFIARELQKPGLSGAERRRLQSAYRESLGRSPV